MPEGQTNRRWSQKINAALCSADRSSKALRCGARQHGRAARARDEQVAQRILPCAHEGRQGCSTAKDKANSTPLPRPERRFHAAAYGGNCVKARPVPVIAPPGATLGLLTFGDCQAGSNAEVRNIASRAPEVHHRRRRQAATRYQRTPSQPRFHALGRHTKRVYASTSATGQRERSPAGFNPQRKRVGCHRQTKARVSVANTVLSASSASQSEGAHQRRQRGRQLERSIRHEPSANSWCAAPAAPTRKPVSSKRSSPQRRSATARSKTRRNHFVSRAGDARGNVQTTNGTRARGSTPIRRPRDTSGSPRNEQAAAHRRNAPRYKTRSGGGRNGFDDPARLAREGRTRASGARPGGWISRSAPGSMCCRCARPDAESSRIERWPRQHGPRLENSRSRAPCTGRCGTERRLLLHRLERDARGSGISDRFRGQRGPRGKNRDTTCCSDARRTAAAGTVRTEDASA